MDESGMFLPDGRSLPGAGGGETEVKAHTVQYSGPGRLCGAGNKARGVSGVGFGADEASNVHAGAGGRAERVRRRQVRSNPDLLWRCGHYTESTFVYTTSCSTGSTAIVSWGQS